MKNAHRHSAIGDKVKITDPRTGKQVTGTVDWISPTRGTIQVRLAEGLAYEFPEWDGTYPPSTWVEWHPVAGMTESFESTIAKGNANAN